MNEIYRHSALGVALFLLLAACSGGGSGGGPEDAPMVSGDPWQLGPATVQDITGGDTPGFADDDVGPALDGLTQSADSFLVSDVLVRTADGSDHRGQTSCQGTACESMIANVPLPPLRLSLSDLSYTDQESDTDTEYQAVATHRGVSLAQGRGSSPIAGLTVERFGYGGWLDHSYFISESGTISEGAFQGTGLEYSYSAGAATGTNPSSTGGGSWIGVMAGADVSGETTRGNRIQGDAEITIADFADPKVGVSFTSIHDLATGTAHTDMSWSGIPLINGGFMRGSGGDSIDGRFYGPSHEEVGGVFERNEILGAFGAKR